MALIGLAWKSARARAGATILTLIAIALSTALVLGVEKVRAGARSGFEQTVSGADMLVGARSGSVNLLLYAVFRLGDPTVNVSWESYQTFARRPDVAWTIPLSLGDSHRGFRVLGTTEAYFEHYRYRDKRPLAFASGARFEKTRDAVLGAEVARTLGYDLGDSFVISHGIQSVAFAEHTDHPFTVSGVLAPTGTPVDRTVHVSLAGLEAVHEGWRDGAPPPIRRRAIGARPAPASQAPPEPAPEDVTPTAITAFLVGMKNKVAVLRYQRDVNTYRQEALTGVIPGVALSQLWRVLGPAEQALRGVSALVGAAGLTGLLISLLSTLNERRREIAVLRAVGARRRDVFGLLVLESTLVAGLGAVIGAGVLNLVLAGFGRSLEAAIGAPLGGLGLSPFDVYIVAGVTVLGVMLGFVPGWIAYQRSLSDGLTVRL
ncbi:MAG: ABC transporter permease [Maricaulaceae bacterium]